MDSIEGGSANLYLWHGRALVIGPGIDSTPHAHYAVQITLGLDAPFRVRLSPEAEWSEVHAAVFSPSQPHQLDCGGRMLAHLFIEVPQPVETVLDADFHSLPQFARVRTALEAARAGRLDLDSAADAAQQWLACVLPVTLSPSRQEGYDSRIARALAWIASHPGLEPDGATLAAQVHLSQSRFTHLFREQTGLTLSRYLLWTRLLDGVAAVADGDSMTGAAHRAGFSDLAHMSRTFRHTFGVMPSELHKMTIAFKRQA